jgi:uncharacterized protein
VAKPAPDQGKAAESLIGKANPPDSVEAPRVGWSGPKSVHPTALIRSTVAPTDTSIATYTGRILDLAAPRASDIAIEDIVAGLSKVCRFGGQSLRFYSVAQHAVAVSLAVEHLGRSDLGLAALHHDSHEAYTCDVPRPLKTLLNPDYDQVTGRLDRAIAEHFGIELPRKGTADGDLIKAADDAVLLIEADALLHGGVDALGGDVAARAADHPTRKAALAGVSSFEQPWSIETAAYNFRRLHDGFS